MKRRVVLVVVALLIVVVGVCASGHVMRNVNGGDEEVNPPTLDYVRQHGYPVNHLGMTYGPEDPESEILPDLLLAENEDGIVGYVLTSDVIGEPPTREDVLAGDVDGSREIPMYTSDMEEVVGYFSMG